MRRCLAMLGVLATVGGCAATVDPFKREGTYAPTGVNDDNLRAEIVNPVDLQQGTGATDSLGVSAATAVARLRTDKVKALPDSTIARISPGGNGSQGGSDSGAGVTQ